MANRRAQVSPFISTQQCRHHLNNSLTSLQNVQTVNLGRIFSKCPLLSHARSTKTMNVLIVSSATVLALDVDGKAQLASTLEDGAPGRLVAPLGGASSSPTSFSDPSVKTTKPDEKLYEWCVTVRGVDKGKSNGTLS